jgi:hypothetical protein
MDYDIAQNIFVIYRALYKGEGVEPLAKDFAFISQKIVNRRLVLEDLFNECYNDMVYVHEAEPPELEVNFLVNTFDLIGCVVNKMKTTGQVLKLKQATPPSL